jgi:hypothetical protein
MKMLKLSLTLTLLYALNACVSKTPPPDSPASTAPAPTAVQSSVEAKEVAAQENAAFVVEVEFPRTHAALTKKATDQLDQFLAKVHKAGKIAEFKVVSWGDVEYPSPATKKLSKSEQRLADHRNKSVQVFLQAQAHDTKVSAYNMTTRPNVFQDWLNTADAEVKKAFEVAGIPNSDSSVKIPSKARRTVVMAVLK